jgi:uncharacterized protein (TIRG00374 family)
MAMTGTRAEKKRSGGWWWRFAVSLGLILVLLFFLADPREAWQRLKGADPVYLFWMLAWLTADRFLMSYKWTLLVRCRGLALGQGEALRAYYLGTLAGSFLPTTLGADALRVGAASGPGRPSEVMAASVVMERALGLVASALAGLAALTLLAQLAVHGGPGSLGWTVGLTLGLAALTVAALLLSLSAWAGRRAAWLEERLAGRGKVAGWLGKFLTAYHQYRAHPRVLAVFLLLSLLEQAAPVVANWLAAQALHYDLSLLAAAAVTPVAISLARLPIWFSAFGVVEGLYVFFFGLVGIAPTQAFLLGLATNLSSIVISLPGLFFYLTGGLHGPGREPRQP